MYSSLFYFDKSEEKITLIFVLIIKYYNVISLRYREGFKFVCRYLNTSIEGIHSSPLSNVMAMEI